MKKLFLTLPVILLIAAACNVATQPLNLSVTVLKTDDGETGPGMYEDKYPSNITVDGASQFANQIAAYGAAYSVWIGLPGWTGSGGEGVDGNQSADLYPMGGNSDSGERISYYAVPGCLFCMLSDASIYFPNALASYNQEYNQDGKENISVPDGLAVTVVSPTLVKYTLPDSNGLSTHGVAYYDSTNQTDPYMDAKVVLPSADDNLSSFILQTFINREGLK